MKKDRLYKTLVWILRPLIKLLYRLEIHGQEKIPEQGMCILCSNHISVIDPIFLGVISKRPVHFMAKEELFRNPWIGKFLQKLGAFPVRRGKQDQDALLKAENLLQKGHVLGIFIEGTRSKDGRLLKPKSGAAMIAYKTKAPIIPIDIYSGTKGSVRLFRKVTVSFSAPLYYEDLQFSEGTGTEFRNASRMIMKKIEYLNSSMKG